MGCLSTAVLAQPAPPNPPGGPPNPPEHRDDNRRPQPGDKPQANPQRRAIGEGEIHGNIRIGEPPMKMEKGAYLGVSTSPAPQVVRQQLGLQRGVGLVIDAVAPKSPAEAAGVKPMDVLHKVNDQLMINPQQLAVLVRTFKPEQSITLTVFREGKSVDLTAKLEERDLPPLDQMRLFNEWIDLPGLDPRHMEGMPNLPQQPNVERIDPFRPPQGRAINRNMTLVWDDGKIQMTMTMQDGKKHLIARDHEGKELYNGPADTEEDQQKMPQEVRERLPKVNMSGGMFRIGPNGPGEKREPEKDQPEKKPENKEEKPGKQV
jgi:hypothetical protein